jgi:hypothetical protein
MKVKITNDRMKEIYKAMGNYLVANRRLPCPASIIKVKTVNSDYGTESLVSECVGSGIYQSTTSSNLVYGMVPVRTLGLSNDMAEDGFGSKIAYIVHKKFTKASETAPNFLNETFSTTSHTNIITVNEKPSAITQKVTDDALIIMISYGANKSGAFDANSATQIARSSDTDELSNDIGLNPDTVATTAIFDNIIVTSSGNSDVFDDMVFFKRRNDFVEDFNAMFLIPCNDAGLGFGSANANYGQTVYTVVETCPEPLRVLRGARKCEAYGAWVDIETYDCIE